MVWALLGLKHESSHLSTVHRPTHVFEKCPPWKWLISQLELWSISLVVRAHNCSWEYAPCVNTKEGQITNIVVKHIFLKCLSTFWPPTIKIISKYICMHLSRKKIYIYILENVVEATFLSKATKFPSHITGEWLHLLFLLGCFVNGV